MILIEFSPSLLCCEVFCVSFPVHTLFVVLFRSLSFKRAHTHKHANPHAHIHIHARFVSRTNESAQTRTQTLSNVDLHTHTPTHTSHLHTHSHTHRHMLTVGNPPGGSQETPPRRGGFFPAMQIYGKEKVDPAICNVFFVSHIIFLPLCHFDRPSLPIVKLLCV